MALYNDLYLIYACYYANERTVIYGMIVLSGHLLFCLRSIKVESAVLAPGCHCDEFMISIVQACSMFPDENGDRSLLLLQCHVAAARFRSHAGVEEQSQSNF